MRRRICAVVAAVLLLSLAACGSSIDINYDSPPTQEPTPTLEPTPDPTEPPPSLDEIIDVIFQYAEDEGLQLTDGAYSLISEMYDNGATDAYSIFQSLRSSGVCVPESTGGIIVGNFKYGGTYYNYKSTGTYKCTVFTAELDSIDPETGVVTHLRTFSSEDTHSCSAVLPVICSDKPYSLRCFDSTFSRMVATLTLEDGAQHVGWIDEYGNFTDVSQKVTPDAGDFAALTKHSGAFFGPDDYFYFWEDDPISTLKRVPLNNLSVSAVEVIDENRDWHWIFPDGTRTNNKWSNTWYYYDEDMAYPARDGYFSDWISPSVCVGVDNGMIYKYTLSGTLDIYEWSSESTALVPNITGRTNKNPIVSPDKSQVAFLSKLTTGTATSSDLFIVPVDGGEPVKVPTDYIFTDNVTWLITWE